MKRNIFASPSERHQSHPALLRVNVLFVLPLSLHQSPPAGRLKKSQPDPTPRSSYSKKLLSCADLPLSLWLPSSISPLSGTGSPILPQSHFTYAIPKIGSRPTKNVESLRGFDHNSDFDYHLSISRITFLSFLVSLAAGFHLSTGTGHRSKQCSCLEHSIPQRQTLPSTPGRARGSSCCSSPASRP
jgi:hypothetical protein